jgi:hypothetical protein
MAGPTHNRRAHALATRTAQRAAAGAHRWDIGEARLRLARDTPRTNIRLIPAALAAQQLGVRYTTLVRYTYAQRGQAPRLVAVRRDTPAGKNRLFITVESMDAWSGHRADYAARVAAYRERLANERVVMRAEDVLARVVVYTGSIEELHGQWAVTSLCRCFICQSRVRGPRRLVLGDVHNGQMMSHVRPESVRRLQGQELPTQEAQAAADEAARILTGLGWPGHRD